MTLERLATPIPCSLRIPSGRGNKNGTPTSARNTRSWRPSTASASSALAARMAPTQSGVAKSLPWFFCLRAGLGIERQFTLAQIELAFDLAERLVADAASSAQRQRGFALRSQ